MVKRFKKEMITLPVLKQQKKEEMHDLLYRDFNRAGKINPLFLLSPLTGFGGFIRVNAMMIPAMAGTGTYGNMPREDPVVFFFKRTRTF